ncbi:hypothetical protein GN958_ATG12448 [Phytophthora infestans]|uniref:Uncharacterized protein n=1 Tax=Phytophthora infestans TaxID=4787 RepID=A0A8S9UC91_PHYIN|nr:hypothetical protein GN958_ATG12448 [Phytophthora infestans]
MLKFAIKDMGVAEKCLIISIQHLHDSIILHQQDTIEELLTTMAMAASKAAHTPMNVEKKFDDDLPMEQTSIMRKAI